MIGDIDVLRVSHHGSQTSSNQFFLNVLRPEVAIISVGRAGRNRLYHHPHRAVLKRLRGLSTLKRIFMTQKGKTTGGLGEEELQIITVVNGNVILKTNGKSYEVNGTVYPTDNVQALRLGGPNGGARTEDLGKGPE